MKIAVACEGKQITEHFGHCQNFRIYTVENKTIVKEESVPNPGHKPGVLPNFLADMGVKVIIASGMGGGAVEIFNDRDVEVILGCSGDSKAKAEEYIAGNLVSTGSICHSHDYTEK